MRRIVVLASGLAAIAVAIVLLAGSFGAADASSTIRLTCVGDGFRLVNNSAESISFSVRFYDASGAPGGTQSDPALESRKSAAGTDAGSFSSIVTTAKSARVLGWQSTIGFSECVKTK